MYVEASLDPERCNFESDLKARNLLVSTHARQIGQFEDVGSPHNIPQEA